MSFSISGKTAIVTGAANGVGLAIGRHFTKMGANVVFADMDEKALFHEIGEDADKEENIRLRTCCPRPLTHLSASTSLLTPRDR